jgi:hypothetical protein
MLWASICDTLITRWRPVFLITLLLTVTGSPRIELLTFLKSVPGVTLVTTPAGCCPLPTDGGPDLVVVDASSSSPETEPLVRAVKRWMPRAHCVVLAGSVRALKDLDAVGADHVLLTGFSAPEFFRVVEDLALKVRYS